MVPGTSARHLGACCDRADLAAQAPHPRRRLRDGTESRRVRRARSDPPAWIPLPTPSRSAASAVSTTCKCAGLEALPFDAGEFDLLLACDVLEHVLRRRRSHSAELLRVADTGANLIITAPAYQWLWTEHDVQLHHFRRYTLKTPDSASKSRRVEPRLFAPISTRSCCRLSPQHA